LEELTTQGRTIFYGDVHLATDSWRVQLHSPSGGKLNYDSEALSEASPVFFGSHQVKVCYQWLKSIFWW